MSNNKELTDEEKDHMNFFETLLPEVALIKQEDIYAFRNRVNQIVQKFIFPSRTRSKKRRSNYNDRKIDLIDISEESDIQVPRPIIMKNEKTQDRDTKESMSLELAKLRKDFEEMRKAKVPYPMVYPNYNMAMDGYNGMIPDQFNPMQPQYGVPLNNVHDETANAANNQEHRENQDKIKPWY